MPNLLCNYRPLRATHRKALSIRDLLDGPGAGSDARNGHHLDSDESYY